jgi:hypothetical protein
MGDPFPAPLRRTQSTVARVASKELPLTEVSTVAVTDFVLALSGLLGSLLVPFAGLYWMLRLKRRAVVPAAAVPVPGRLK